MTRGRRATGLRRPNIVQVTFNDQEAEFIARKSIESGISSATYGRMLMLTRDWKETLIQLREDQHNAPLHKLDGRRKEV